MALSKTMQLANYGIVHCGKMYVCASAPNQLQNNGHSNSIVLFAGFVYIVGYLNTMN